MTLTPATAPTLPSADTDPVLVTGWPVCDVLKGCILPASHDGDHFDGAHWYDDAGGDADEGHQAPAPVVQPAYARIAICRPDGSEIGAVVAGLADGLGGKTTEFRVAYWREPSMLGYAGVQVRWIR